MEKTTTILGRSTINTDPLEVSGEVDSEEEETKTFDHAPFEGVCIQTGDLFLGLAVRACHRSSENLFHCAILVKCYNISCIRFAS